MLVSGIVSKFPLMLQLLLKTSDLWLFLTSDENAIWNCLFSRVISDFDENAILNCLLRMPALSTESRCKTPFDLIGGMVLSSAFFCLM